MASTIGARSPLLPSSVGLIGCRSAHGGIATTGLGQASARRSTERSSCGAAVEGAGER
jgi:hypothetical protein